MPEGKVLGGDGAKSHGSHCTDCSIASDLCGYGHITDMGEQGGGGGGFIPCDCS